MQQRQRKRNNQVTITDAANGDANKKGKTSTTGSPSAASIIFGDLAKDNFKDEDVTNWSKRSKVKAGFCFKQALEKSFFHGLDLLNSPEGKKFRIQSSLISATNSHDYIRACWTEPKRK